MQQRRVTRKRGGAKRHPDKKKKSYRLNKTTKKVQGVSFKPTRKNAKKNIKHVLEQLRENKNLHVSNPIEYIHQIIRFLKGVSDKANVALRIGKTAMYNKYTIIATFIAENVSQTLKEHASLLKSDADELADILESMTLNGTPRANQTQDLFDALMDDSEVYSDPLTYVENLAEAIEEFLEMYEDVIEEAAYNVNTNVRYSSFAVHLASSLHEAVEAVREHLKSKTKEMTSIASMGMNVEMNAGPAAVPTATRSHSPVPRNNQNIADLASLFDTTLKSAFHK